MVHMAGLHYPLWMTVMSDEMRHDGMYNDIILYKLKTFSTL